MWNLKKKNLLDLWVIDVPRHVSYRTFEAWRLSAQLFDTLHRMPAHTFFSYFDFSTQPSARTQLSSLSRFNFAIYVQTGSELVLEKNNIVFMKCLKYIWLQFVQGKSRWTCLEFYTLFGNLNVEFEHFRLMLSGYIINFHILELWRCIRV